MKTYLDKTGTRLFSMSAGEYRAYVNDSYGFCLSCGAEHSQIEPDAEGYSCDSCEEPEVMGIENMLLEGRVNLPEG